MSGPSPLSRKALLDEYFIANRTRLLEIAAFLDRLDRAEPQAPGDAEPRRASDDFRLRAFVEAVESLTRTTRRVDHIQALFSDPTTEPLVRLDRKSAVGAYDRWSQEAQS